MKAGRGLRRVQTPAGSVPAAFPEGYRIGHATDRKALTGCTVILPPPETLNEAFDRGVSEGLGAARRAQRITLASADHREARAAFAERRPPRFSGR